MKYRDELKWIAPIVVVCVLLFANTIGGEFVYDDQRQILRNPLIQDNSLIGKALTSDVWAFKGDGKLVASNYWRPTFTAWHILNFRLFGANPGGWHVLNILLHAGVCVLVFLLLRRWQFSKMTALAISLIFAVHPTRVESVAWISGSPDLLFGLAFFGSLWFAMNDAETKKRASKKLVSGNLILAIILYALALGAKEIGILCLPIYYLIYRTDSLAETKKENDRFVEILTFLGVAVIYFIARLGVLGAISRPPEDAVGIVTAILSVPAILTFYLRQMFFPVWLGANYPLQPVETIGLMNFFVPLIISGAFVAALFYLVKQSKNGVLAVFLFALPLLPAMNSTAFIPDQIVHDRYLYIPLLGILMLTIPLIEKFLQEKKTLIVCGILSLGLVFQTFFYNRAWLNEFDLWAWSVKNDDSAFTSAQFGSQLLEKGRFDEAVQAYTNSLQKRPTFRSYYGRGRGFVGKKQFAEAEKDFLKVLENPNETEVYLLYQTYESLAIVYLEQKNFDEALKKLDEARRNLPIYIASLTVKKAVVLYQKGQKDEALRELENVKDKARQELLPEAKAVFLRLGMLYAELGRKNEAKNNLQEYLKLTEKFRDTTTLRERPQAVNLLKTL